MISQITLICAILPFIQALFVPQNNPVDHDPPALLGPDKFCFFAYSTRAKVETIRQFYPNAERVGVARLPFHRLDFYYYLEEVKGSIPTVVPDCGYEVWGALYTIPISDLQLVLSKGSVAGNKTVFRFVQKIIETYSNGNLINLKCNTFQQIELPEKVIYGLPLPQNQRPSRGTLNRMIDAFQDAGLPRRYIEEISWIPTRDQNILKTNQAPTSQQHPVVVTAPNSVVVAPDSTVVTQNSDDDDR